MNRKGILTCGASALMLIAVNSPLTASAQDAKHVDNAYQSRLILTFRSNPAEVQRWVPAGWQIAPPASGPSKDVNLFLIFVERLLDQDPAGKPAAAPVSRVVALAVPARNPQTGESSPLVVRTYDSSPEGAPGFYKVGVRAAVERELILRGSDQDPGVASERWRMKDERGGTIELQAQYQRGRPSPVKPEIKPRSGLDPNVWRIYRQDYAVDMVKSVPANIDRLKSYRLQVKVPELEKLFDGNEQLLNVISVPWYMRQTFVPQH